ncbi:cutinase family protein (plasmid) [Streptomyces sp. NBC_01007]|nr:cutinase family protein [Streptomyces sp. NBC_01007]
MSGDWLSKLALTYLGDANRWPEIYDANKSLIEDTAKAHTGPPVFGTSDHGHWIFPGTNLIIPGICGQPPASRVTPTGVPPCTHGTFLIGVHGTNDVPPENLGEVVGALAKALQRPDNRDPNGVTVYGIPYPGSVVNPIYDESVAEGEVSLIDVLQAHAQCADEKIVIAGYSQGAQVIRDALAGLKNLAPDVVAKVSGIALFGDPTVDLLGFPNGASADSLGVPVVGPYCKEEDPVCGTRNAELAAKCAIEATLGQFVGQGVACGHFRYVPSSTDDAAKKIRDLPRR